MFYCISTISKMYGLDENDVLQFFQEEKIIDKKSDCFVLTQKGSQYGLMQKKRPADSYNYLLLWNDENIANLLKGLKNSIIKNHKNQFRLYHMTHIDNLQSILSSGYLMSHNQIKSYKDISNNSVNARRAKKENVFGNSIHDYVPLYFNPRNAMLFSVQRQYDDDIVVLEINREVCLKPYTLFSYKNASADDARFTENIKIFLNAETNFSIKKIVFSKKLGLKRNNVIDKRSIWYGINQDSWSDDETGKIKKVMMSECLIYQNIPVNYIINIHCKTQSASQKIENILERCNNTDIENIYYNSNLFF